MLRRWILVPLLATAVAVPALLMDKKSGKEGQNVTGDLFSGNFLGLLEGGDGQYGEPVDTSLNQLTEEEAEMLNPNSINYAPGATDFRDVFRFDANPQWLQKNWPLVTKSRSWDGLTSYRVPLVTGPNPYDLTGALTYYFNSRNLCERIAFYGFTSEPSRVLQLGTETFKLRSDRNSDSGIYTSRFGRKVRSVMIIENPTIMLKNASPQQLQVTIELNNPNGIYALSQEMQEIVNSLSGLNNESVQRNR